MIQKFYNQFLSNVGEIFGEFFFRSIWANLWQNDNKLNIKDRNSQIIWLS